MQALDLASWAANSLLVVQPPAQRLAYSQAALQQAMSSKMTGRSLDPYLHRAAKDALAAGQYDVSLDYVKQLLALVRSGPAVTPYLHWAHTIAGLDRLAKGELDLAVSELNLSIEAFPTGTFGPSMALANALISRRPDSVVSYLDAAGKMQSWPGHSQAAVWKAQIQAGQTPNFGGLVTLGVK